MAGAELIRVPIFPLAGALLFPRTQLPLHIFEPRYRAMVRDALAGEKLIVMVQPRDSNEPPAVFEIGCLGRIVGSEQLSDGRYNIVLQGIHRIRIAREAEVETPYRQVDAECGPFRLEEEEPLAIAQRADLERECRRFADALGYAVDWQAVAQLDDQMLVNGIAQIIPLELGAKQALLEATGLGARADLLVQLMEFQRLAPGGPDMTETLQ
jgi:Lon protease-like protein